MNPSEPRRRPLSIERSTRAAPIEEPPRLLPIERAGTVGIEDQGDALALDADASADAPPARRALWRGPRSGG